jgi:hypothetical protein
MKFKDTVSLSELADDLIPTETDLGRFIDNCTQDFRKTKECIFWKRNVNKMDLKSSQNRLRIRFPMNGKQHRVQRLSFIWFHGKEISDKKHITITCENKNCINPRHMTISNTEKNKKTLLTKILKNELIKKELLEIKEELLTPKIDFHDSIDYSDIRDIPS